MTRLRLIHVVILHRESIREDLCLVLALYVFRGWLVVAGLRLLSARHLHEIVQRIRLLVEACHWGLPLQVVVPLFELLVVAVPLL